jgi:hypothetical protein
MQGGMLIKRHHEPLGRGWTNLLARRIDGGAHRPIGNGAS